MSNSHHYLKKQAKLAKRLAKQAARGNPDLDLVGLKFANGPQERHEWDVIMRKDARDLVVRGKAEWCDNAKAIRIRERHPDYLFGTMGTGFPTGNGRRYDKIGLEMFPIQLIGGLCRTETQPSPHSRAPGWRPLH